MMFNLKNGNDKVMPKNNIPVISSNQVVIIGSKQYIIDKIDTIKVHPYTDDVKPYGWTLEIGHDINGKVHYCDYSRKVYTTRDSAVQAMIQIKKRWDSSGVFWRVSALYRMEALDWRDYLIKEIFKEDPPKNKYEMKFWKVKEDSTFIYRGFSLTTNKGDVYVQYENGEIGWLATPSKISGWGNYRRTLDGLIENNLVEEVDIMTQRWIHPHLPIQLKNKLNVR